MNKLFVVVCLIAVLSTSNQAGACSTFSIQSADKIFMAKSYDWNQGHGLLPRGIRQTLGFALPRVKASQSRVFNFPFSDFENCYKGHASTLANSRNVKSYFDHSSNAASSHISRFLGARLP